MSKEKEIELTWIDHEQSGTDYFQKAMDEVEKASSEMKHTNIIITGKTGIGKSTLINSVLRKPLAQTGIGKPVSQQTKVYEDDELPIRIYDTKGLELDANVQNEIIRDIKDLILRRKKDGDDDQYIHAIWYCFNCMGSRLEPKDLEWIQTLCNQGEAGIPVIAVITQCFDMERAKELKKWIDRELNNLPQYCGCVLVLAEKSKSKHLEKIKPFGLQELVRITVNILPDSAKRAFINAQKASTELKVKVAQKYLQSYIKSAAATGATPVPFSDAPLLIANEFAMLAHLTFSFGVNLDKASVAGLISLLIGIPVVTATGKSIVKSVLKIVPGVSVAASIASGATAALLTAALGRTYIWILEQIALGEITEEDLKSKSFKSKIEKKFKHELNKKSLKV